MAKVDVSNIVTFIKNSKKAVGKKEILAATGYSGNFEYAMKKVMSENAWIVKNTGTNPAQTTYSISPLMDPPKQDKSEMKNSEGYPDGTAGKAIANVMRSSNGGKYPMRQEFGEVWSSSNVVDDQEGFLIVSAKEGVCICYGVYPTKKPFMKADYTMRWTDDNSQMHYISTINPVNISERKLLKKLFVIGDAEKECVKISALRALGIDIPEAEEKVRVVEVADPKTEKKMLEYRDKCDELLDKNQELSRTVDHLKELIDTSQPGVKVEYRTDPAEIEMAVLKATCAIYEKILFDKGNPYFTRFKAVS